jgi:hypothetical protein
LPYRCNQDTYPAESGGGYLLNIAEATSRFGDGKASSSRLSVPQSITCTDIEQPPAGLLFHSSEALTLDQGCAVLR